jgi:hypothetical protein
MAMIPTPTPIPASAPAEMPDDGEVEVLSGEAGVLAALAAELTWEVVDASALDSVL